MRASVVIIIFSFAANVVLAMLLLQGNAGFSIFKAGAPKTEVAAVTTASDAGTQNESAPAVAGKISWRDLQAEDLKEFIRRLRAVNCPETTVQDLVLAEVNRRYAPKLRELWPAQTSQTDYWKSYKHNFDPAEQKKNRGRMHQQQDLQKEKTALLVELLGVDVEKLHRQEEGLDDINWNPGGNLAFLPASKRDDVQKFLDSFEDKEQEFYASIKGGWDSDDRAEQKKLEQEKFAGLAQILTPDELREYELRNSQTANQLASEIRGVSITRAQYEALFDISQKYGDSIYNYSDDANDPDTVKQIEQNKKDMQADIATALGADTAQQLERAQDYSYQSLNSLAAHNNLPADTASKVYDVKDTSDKAVQDLQANTDLTPEQRQAALSQIRTETEQAVKTALGDKLYQRYLNNGGWWLNNIAPGN